MVKRVCHGNLNLNLRVRALSLVRDLIEPIRASVDRSSSCVVTI